jgi:hypothetical protein
MVELLMPELTQLNTWYTTPPKIEVMQQVQVKVLESFAGPNGSYGRNSIVTINLDYAKSLMKCNLVEILEEIEDPEKPIAKLVLIKEDEKAEETTGETTNPVKRKYTPRKTKTATKQKKK